MPNKDEMIKAVRDYLENIKVSDEVIEDEISDENLEASYELIQKHPDNMPFMAHIQNILKFLAKTSKILTITRVCDILLSQLAQLRLKRREEK